MRRSLSKGLSHLVGEPPADSALPTSEIAVGLIEPNARQPRTAFDEDGLEELAASIREVGIVQPLIVRPAGGGRYELIAGERRLRAAKKAGLATVPVVVRSASEQGSLELALIENIQREDINAIEAARAYRRLADEFGLNQEQIAARVGKSRVTVANALRLLRLPARILAAVEAGELSEGHARAMLQFAEPEKQLAVFETVLAKGLTVRDVERLAQEQPPTPAKKERAPVSRYLSAERYELEDRIARHFGSPVKIKLSGTGGKLSVEFFNEEDFQRILDALGISL
ncbi:MAG: ParB/RepB/Spo0J family partition protein [Fimbriimonadaceae bacterium]|nr:ParB/RepB/Spo0J family partition protein [Fimbriimonadaceae bacterium]